MAPTGDGVRRDPVVRSTRFDQTCRSQTRGRCDESSGFHACPPDARNGQAWKPKDPTHLRNHAYRCNVRASPRRFAPPLSMLTRGRLNAARQGDIERGPPTNVPSLCRTKCLFYKQLASMERGGAERRRGEARSRRQGDTFRSDVPVDVTREIRSIIRLPRLSDERPQLAVAAREVHDAGSP